MDELVVSSTPVIIDQFELIITCPLTYGTRIKARFRQVSLGNVRRVMHPMLAPYELPPAGRAPDRFHRRVGDEHLTYTLLSDDPDEPHLVMVKNVTKEASVPLILDDFKKMMLIPQCVWMEHRYGEVHGHMFLMNGAEDRAYEVQIRNAEGKLEEAIDRVTFMLDRSKYGVSAEVILFNGSSMVQINHVGGDEEKGKNLEKAADVICILLTNAKSFAMEVVLGPALVPPLKTEEERVEAEEDKGMGPELEAEEDKRVTEEEEDKLRKLERRMTTK